MGSMDYCMLKCSFVARYMGRLQAVVLLLALAGMWLQIHSSERLASWALFLQPPCDDPTGPKCDMTIYVDFEASKLTKFVVPCS